MQKETQRETQSLCKRANNDQNEIYTGNVQIIPTKNMQAQLKMLHLTIHGSEKDKIHLTQISLIFRSTFR
jgi:hypothetical protein